MFSFLTAVSYWILFNKKQDKVSWIFRITLIFKLPLFWLRIQAVLNETVYLFSNKRPFLCPIFFSCIELLYWIGSLVLFYWWIFFYENRGNIWVWCCINTTYSRVDYDFVFLWYFYVNLAVFLSCCPVESYCICRYP